MNWPLVPLGEVLQEVTRPTMVQPTDSYRMLGVRLDNCGPFLRETVTGNEISAKTVYRVEVGDFIYSRLFAWRGAFGVIGPELAGCFVSNEFPTYRPARDVLVEFVEQWFRMPQALRAVEALCTGSTPLTRNRLKEEAFATLQMPLPPVEEQRRIVARVDAIATRATEARRLREQAEKERDALLGQYLRARLSKPYPAHWVAGKLRDVVADCCYGTSEKTEDDRNGIPVLRMGNIQDGQLNFESLKYLPQTSFASDNMLLQCGDILVNRTNSAELVGKCAVFDRTDTFSFASYLIRVRVDQSKADPFFIARYINCPLGRQYMFDERRQMTGQANVNSTKLLALPLPLPPLDEQRRIVAHLDALQAKLDAVRAEQQATAAELDALLPSVLNRAFAGQL